MINIILNIIIIFGCTCLIVDSVWMIKYIIQKSKSKSSKCALSFKDNLADMNKNFKNIKDYYALYIYTSAYNNNSFEYRIHSKPYWKDVSRIYHDTIDVYLKGPFGFSDFCVGYTLSDYTLLGDYWGSDYVAKAW